VAQVLQKIFDERLHFLFAPTAPVMRQNRPTFVVAPFAGDF
jgi:hypothetical protein